MAYKQKNPKADDQEWILGKVKGVVGGDKAR